MAEGHNVLRRARALRPLVRQPLEAVVLPKHWSERGADLFGQHLREIGTYGMKLRKPE